MQGQISFCHSGIEVLSINRKFLKLRSFLLILMRMPIKVSLIPKKLIKPLSKWLKLASLAILLMYSSALFYLYINQKAFLYAPKKDLVPFTSHALKDVQEIFLTTQDNNSIQAWYHHAGNPAKVVIYLHGSNGSLVRNKARLQALQNQGYSYIIPAWRGFGKSSGSPSEQGLYADAEAAIQYLVNQGFDTKNTILIGESLGTGIATEMANRYPFKGLFLIAPYTSIVALARATYSYLPISQCLIKDNFKVLEKIKKIGEAALLIVHGDQDQVIPHSHSQQIISQANMPKKLIIYPGVNHTNFVSQAIFMEMENFF